MEFKDKIKNRRLELNLTLEEVAKAVGVSTPTILRYESGEIKNVRRDKIKLLADALQVTPSYLMDWDEKEETQKKEIPGLTEKEILTRAAHKVGHEGPLTDEELDNIKLAIQIALAKHKK
ncbi:helix-turn-helix domain-containing protein [Geosporobacter ferrireducens]|uniref:helix-turn-helix domain-containing protein n=1 Tax=Geosporobacter ferrireducens TaxID=1424294 RepID=UPI00139C3EA9|nr:helix-turn-helix transcriptional regulator [Geosporobacter ferrireducens]MTI56121.1 helix-turn-helix transcriptional regulator [Geosporobacter ferrireducens]